eukprot:TRINITY_DN2833_c0_g1_i1.p1 TRINITY_DN2833_c0_g1~~TRINITY_DN2833_c0_g1_i1.p1  ORF type:complete len:229 (-),score=27.35 TRINITY_DN2833_c0_g1_i1:641-1327(-)
MESTSSSPSPFDSLLQRLVESANAEEDQPKEKPSAKQRKLLQKLVSSTGDDPFDKKLCFMLRCLLDKNFNAIDISDLTAMCSHTNQRSVRGLTKLVDYLIKCMRTVSEGSENIIGLIALRRFVSLNLNTSADKTTTELIELETRWFDEIAKNIDAYRECIISWLDEYDFAETLRHVLQLRDNTSDSTTKAMHGVLLNSLFKIHNIELRATTDSNKIIVQPISNSTIPL